jgi:hypothetical protein
MEKGGKVLQPFINSIEIAQSLLAVKDVPPPPSPPQIKINIPTLFK